MKIILVRHGQSIANKKRIHQGDDNKWKDTSLSNIGKTQAKKVAKRLQKEKIDIIYSSPLKRAKQTAEEINKYHNQKIIFDNRIKEMHDFSEDIEIFIQRVQDFLKEISKKNKNILVVAHGGVILTMLAITTQDRKKGGKLIKRHSIGTGNTSINILEKNKDKLKITTLNCMKHLPKRYILKHKAGILYNLPYNIKPFILEEINTEIENGDCRHKTELLKQLFEKEGFKTRKIYTVFNWKDLPIPKEILSTLKSGTKMIHNLLEVNLNKKWIKVDLTWNRDLEKKGFPVTKLWNGKEDTKMITNKKNNFYKTKENAKKEKGINQNKKELHEFAEKLNKWIES